MVKKNYDHVRFKYFCSSDLLYAKGGSKEHLKFEKRQDFEKWGTEPSLGHFAIAMVRQMVKEPGFGLGARLQRAN